LPQAWLERGRIVTLRALGLDYKGWILVNGACIGGALSQIENTLALVQLLRRFTPEYAGPVPAKIHATVTLCPKGGLPFRIRELS